MFNYEQVPKTKEYRSNYDKIFGKGKEVKDAKLTGKVCKEDAKALKKGGKK